MWSYQRPQPIPEELWCHNGPVKLPQTGATSWASVSSPRAVIRCDPGQVTCLSWWQSWRGTLLRDYCEPFQVWEWAFLPSTGASWSRRNWARSCFRMSSVMDKQSPLNLVVLQILKPFFFFFINLTKQRALHPVQWPGTDAHEVWGSWRFFLRTKLSDTWPGTDMSSSALPVSQQVVWRCQL